MYVIFVKVCSSSRCIHFDFIDVVKACERDLYRMNVDPITSYGHVHGVFQIFLPIVHHSYDPLYMAWISQFIYFDIHGSSKGCANWLFKLCL
jgi:hypothetical protein